MLLFSQSVQYISSRRLTLTKADSGFYSWYILYIRSFSHRVPRATRFVYKSHTIISAYKHNKYHNSSQFNACLFDLPVTLILHWGLREFVWIFVCFLDKKHMCLVMLASISKRLHNDDNDVDGIVSAMLFFKYFVFYVILQRCWRTKTNTQLLGFAKGFDWL